MSRHRDPSYFREYAQLVKMLFKEIAHQDLESWNIATRDSRVILGKMAVDHPTATNLVLYVSQDRKKWIVVPVGPDEECQTVAQANRQNPNGKKPVAYSLVK